MEFEQELSPGLRTWLQDVVTRLDSVLEENAKLREENAKLREENAKLREENAKLQARVQELEDEVRRLKNLPRKPKDKRGRGRNVSSEKERKEPKARVTRSKDVPVDRTQRCRVPRHERPTGAVRDGFEETIIQEIEVRRDNVRFRRERWYDKATGNVVIAPLPKGWEDFGFGPTLRATVLTMHWKQNVSQPAIHAFLKDLGIDISEGELSRLLVQTLSCFERERDEVRNAGLETTECVQMDVTSTRVNGKDRSCFVWGDARFTVFDTRPSHDRLQTLASLCGWTSLQFRIDDEVVARAEAAGVGAQHLVMLQRMPQETVLEETTFEAAWKVAFEEEHTSWVGDKTRRTLRELCALSAAWTQRPPLRQLKLHADDARHFDGLAPWRGLCWVHEGRHYAKLQPGQDEAAAEEVAAFRAYFWGLYREIECYRKAPNAQRAKELEGLFDQLFAAQPQWRPLALRIAASRAKKAELLQVVLEHPAMPLHNNAMEQGARVRVRKRAVSGGPRSETGRQAQDTMQSVLETARKLGLSAWAYVRDRVFGLKQIPPLAELVRAHGQLPVPAS
jgi:BMFP domain-containing protein YqiC